MIMNGHLLGDAERLIHYDRAKKRKRKRSEFAVFLILLIVAECFVFSRNRHYHAMPSSFDRKIAGDFAPMTCRHPVAVDTPLLMEYSSSSSQNNIHRIIPDTGDIPPNDIVVRRRICRDNGGVISALTSKPSGGFKSRKLGAVPLLPSSPAPSLVEWHVNATARIAQKKKHFCLPWYIVADDWWTHHPGWMASYETSNDTHYCFQSMNPKRAQFFRQLHRVQHPPNIISSTTTDGDESSSSSSSSAFCKENVFTKPMWQSGWGADFAHIVDGLLYAVDHQVPFQVYNDVPWHYAATKSGNKPVCPTADLNCYFLPLSSCEPNPKRMSYGTKRDKNPDFYYTNKKNVTWQPSLLQPHHRWMMEYATRPQTWLRKAVYDFSKRIPLTPPCTVLHVRRADVVLHGAQSRRYHEIQEYMDVTDPDISGTIFLLTDDSNAIEEATRKYPSHEWVYVPRPRFQGPEGGWENQLPSANPQFEVIVLLTIFQKVTQCQAMIHTQSNFAELLGGFMLEAASHSKEDGGPMFINLDRGKNASDVYNSDFSIGYIVPGGRDVQKRIKP